MSPRETRNSLVWRALEEDEAGKKAMGKREIGTFRSLGLEPPYPQTEGMNLKYGERQGLLRVRGPFKGKRSLMLGLFSGPHIVHKSMSVKFSGPRKVNN